MGRTEQRLVDEHEPVESEEIDVGEAADRLSAAIARGESAGWGGPTWRRVRRACMKIVAHLALGLIVVSLIAGVIAIVAQLF